MIKKYLRTILIVIILSINSGAYARSFPNSAYLRVPVKGESDRFSKLIFYWQSKNNSLMQIKKAIDIWQGHKTILLELGAGNTKLSDKIAANVPEMAVIATDIFNPKYPTNSAYAEYGQRFEKEELVAQTSARSNIATLRSNMDDIIKLIPDSSLDYVLLVNPEGEMTEAFFNSMNIISKKLKPHGQVIYRAFNYLPGKEWKFREAESTLFGLDTNIDFGSYHSCSPVLIWDNISGILALICDNTENEIFNN